MRSSILRLFLFVAALTVIGVAIGCQEQLVEQAATDQTLSATDQTLSEADASFSKGEPPLTATVQFGRNEVGSPFFPPGEHDASTHAKDALQPRTVVISSGGTVTFKVSPFHKIAIYEPGTEPSDIDITLLESAGAPFHFPPVINDPTNRITRGGIAFGGLAVDFAWTFEEPGRYLVICEVLPHFAENDMYGWVIVK